MVYIVLSIKLLKCENVAVSSTTSSQSVRPSSSKGKRSKKELKADSPTHEAEPVFEIPQEMQQMLQSFSRMLTTFSALSRDWLGWVRGSR